MASPIMINSAQAANRANVRQNMGAWRTPGAPGLINPYPQAAPNSAPVAASATVDTPVSNPYNIIRGQATAESERARKVQADAIARRAATQGWGEDSGMLEKRQQIGDVEARRALATRLGQVDVAEATELAGESRKRKDEIRAYKLKAANTAGLSGGTLTAEQMTDPAMVAAYEEGKAGKVMKDEDFNREIRKGAYQAFATGLDLSTPDGRKAFNNLLIAFTSGQPVEGSTGFEPIVTPPADDLDSILREMYEFGNYAMMGISFEDFKNNSTITRSTSEG